MEIELFKREDILDRLGDYISVHDVYSSRCYVKKTQKIKDFFAEYEALCEKYSLGLSVDQAGSVTLDKLNETNFGLITTLEGIILENLVVLNVHA
jgi:hypothetical protein